MKHRLFIVLSGRCFSHQKRRKWSFRLVHVCDRKLRMLSEAPNISSAVQDSRCERPCYLQASRGSCSGRAVAVPAWRVDMHIQPWTDPCNTRQRLFSSFSLTWFILWHKDGAVIANMQSPRLDRWSSKRCCSFGYLIAYLRSRLLLHPK